MHALLKSGLDHSEFVAELCRHRISTPSGKPWNESLVAELIYAVHEAMKRQQQCRAEDLEHSGR
jgi:hypothetical protein